LASIALGIALWHLSSLAPDFRGGEPAYSFQQIGFHLFYAIPLTSYSWLNPVYWSLAYEFVFYVLVGLLFPFLIGRNVIWTVAAAIVVAAVSYCYWAAFDVHILEFLLGILAMRVTCEDRSRRQATGWIVATLVLVFYFGGLRIGFACLASVAAIYFLNRLRLGRWALSIGAVSYSLYLTHTTIGVRVVNLGKRFGEGASYELALIAVALIVSLALAVVFSFLVEKPAIKASRTIQLKKLSR
jgi:peptidoglycan/LPS O-acetylase OafA/YrhL